MLTIYRMTDINWTHSTSLPTMGFPFKTNDDQERQAQWDFPIFMRCS